MKFYKAWLVVCVLAVAGCNNAHYSSSSHINLEKILPPPPAQGSQEEAADINAVLAAQASRTEAQVLEAKLDSDSTPLRFQPVFGEKFTAANLPKTFAFLERAEEDQKEIINEAKEFYQRPRPFNKSADVAPITGKPKSSSYPSGHTSYGYVMGLLLAEMVPEKRAEIEARAEAYGNNRVIAGVHYPSDVAAGKHAAGAMVAQWKRDKKFMTDFAEAKKETRRVLGLVL